MIKQERIRDIIENDEIGKILYENYVLNAFELIDKLAEKIKKELENGKS